jgi:hypothetical protein
MARTTTRQYWQSSDDLGALFECLPPALDIYHPQTGKNAGVDASNKPVETGGHGGPVADAEEISRADIHARVDKIPREQLPALAKVIDDFAVGGIEATADTRLSRLQGRFAKRLREIELPEDGFTTLAQLKAADQLARTYRDLRDVRSELKLPKIEKPEAVAKAEALASDWRRHHDKTGAVLPPRPRGRPRRIAPDQAVLSQL